MMAYLAVKARVANRGTPPDSFLAQLIDWGRTAPEEIFAPNNNPADIYAYIKPVLGPWDSLLHRRAALMEAARVHAGLEASWNFNEDYDKSNPASIPGTKTAETGVFQVSFDSTEIDHNAMLPFAVASGIGTVGSFIPAMKSNHKLCFEYYARLIRINVQWAGPIKRHEIDPWLSRAAVKEFETFLNA